MAEHKPDFDPYINVCFREESPTESLAAGQGAGDHHH